MTPSRQAVTATLLSFLLAGCSLPGSADEPPGRVDAEAVATTPPDAEDPEASPPVGADRGASAPEPDAAASEADPDAADPDGRAATRRTPDPAALSSDGRPRRALLSIPAIGLRDLSVLPYRGRPDDAPGTRIQNGGVAASPHGARGGVGPAGVGNYIVTAHRTSSTRAFADLPSVRAGDAVHVVAAGTRYTYRVTRTRSTSFRSAASLARQSAAVPGRPGREPTRAMITLSTCATPEDHARGNYWSDEFGNPEHRIDKVGVLVTAVPARAATD